MPTTTPAGAPPAPIPVAVVEDDAGIRESLVAFLAGAPGVRCVAVYPDAEQAVEGLKTARPEVVLMDINLPGMSGIEATRALKQLHPELRILMLTVYEDNKTLFDSLKAGACGYLLKRAASEKIVAAIREAREGGMPLTPRMAAKVAAYFQGLDGARSELESLTQRERQTLELLAEGFLYKEIADRLGVSYLTVNQFVKHIYEKLHVHSRTEAVVKFLKQGPAMPRTGYGAAVRPAP
jgi:DNA-binding NarL/FixJ family response regulator